MRKKLTKKTLRLKKEVRKHITTAISAAFALTIALVWRDAINQTVDRLIKYFELQGSGYLYFIYSALITTVICVIGIIIISRYSVKEEKK